MFCECAFEVVAQEYYHEHVGDPHEIVHPVIFPQLLKLGYVIIPGMMSQLGY